jgi:hypothetical protein
LLFNSIVWNNQKMMRSFDNNYNCSSQFKCWRLPFAPPGGPFHWRKTNRLLRRKRQWQRSWSRWSCMYFSQLTKLCLYKKKP